MLACLNRAAVGGLILLSHVAARAFGQTDQTVQWIRTNAVPIAVVHDSAIVLSAKSIAQLKTLTANARVIGLGESMHNSHELSLVRSALSMQLVEQGVVSAVVLESSLPAARRIDRWIIGETDSIPNLTRDLSYGWGFETETVDLLAAIRAHNLTQPPGSRVRFYGMDLPGNGGGTVLPALNPVLTYLDRVDSALSTASRLNVLPIARGIASDGYGVVEKYSKLSPGSRDSLHAGLANIIARLKANRSEYVRRTSQDEYDWTLRYAEVARQTEDAVRVGWNDASNPRDEAMAQNVGWIAQREGSRGVVLVWSHNLHIARDSIGGPVFAGRGGAAFVASLGQWLQKAFGKSYAAIGTAFGKSAMDETPVATEATSIDATLSRVGMPAYFIDLATAPSSGPIANWLTESHLKRVDGGYATMSLRPGFDALVFVSDVREANHPPNPGK